jgi:hypothetical protein
MLQNLVSTYAMSGNNTNEEIGRIILLVSCRHQRILFQKILFASLYIRKRYIHHKIRRGLQTHILARKYYRDRNNRSLSDHLIKKINAIFETLSDREKDDTMTKCTTIFSSKNSPLYCRRTKVIHFTVKRDQLL